jgi:hypothetical protein
MFYNLRRVRFAKGKEIDELVCCRTPKSVGFGKLPECYIDNIKLPDTLPEMDWDTDNGRSATQGG